MATQEETQTVQNWIRDLSASLGVELKLSSDGICSIQIGDEMLITIEISADSSRVNIFSPLVNMPVNDVNATVLLMSKALELNAFQVSTRGGAIAIAPGGGFLFFCYSTPINGVDSQMFGRILGSFFETVSDLKKMLTLPIK